jgi:Ubiquitin carboxyl-terminal hydrolase
MITAVNGLANMGETCFLNTLLQALAACPQFCKWLELHKQSQLASALHEIITCKKNYFARDRLTIFLFFSRKRLRHRIRLTFVSTGCRVGPLCPRVVHGSWPAGLP